MSDDLSKLDTMQAANKSAVETWIAAIRREEDLASVHHDVADVDAWEAAHFREEEARERAKAAKAGYEEELRKTFFGF